MFDPHSLALLAAVAPKLRGKCLATEAVLCPEGIQLRIVQGYRTWAEQDALFAQGPSVTRARGGFSSHNYGLAVDMVPGVVGEPKWTPDWEPHDPAFQRMVAVAKAQGLLWGGDWKTMRGDFDHFYLGPDSPTPELRTLYATAGLPGVWNHCEVTLG